jgi:hypothetical protein
MSITIFKLAKAILTLSIAISTMAKPIVELPKATHPLRDAIFTKNLQHVESLAVWLIE